MGCPERPAHSGRAGWKEMVWQPSKLFALKQEGGGETEKNGWHKRKKTRNKKKKIEEDTTYEIRLSVN